MCVCPVCSAGFLRDPPVRACEVWSVCVCSAVMLGPLRVRSSSSKPGPGAREEGGASEDHLDPTLSWAKPWSSTTKVRRFLFCSGWCLSEVQGSS